MSKYNKLIKTFLVIALLVLVAAMLPVVPARAASIIGVLPTSGPVGTVIQLNGSGTNGENIAISFNAVMQVTQPLL
ncbi:MAG TPA: hypothetical protein VLH15_07575, partial [Dehalococcoidales bacterium]|nr:hypothetical protein [Dehalococcoidales bacterium]